MTEYITKIHPAKEEAVADIKGKLETASDFIVTDYRGLTVEQITGLRRKMREFGAEYKVVKNRYAKIAFKTMGVDGLDPLLVGPTAVALVTGEAGPAAKALFDYAKETPVQVKGGYIDGNLFDKTQLEAFSKLPTRIELISMLMGTMKAPVQNLVYVLNAPVQKLARTLQAVADQKEGN
ncbi:MAG: 50S ribosomal protein L10 [Spirochaetia bacterium]|jgi:large subunit ribosomal protein L10|nr:50S ribosomal protein L10 [Spirochaetia bacterium]